MKKAMYVLVALGLVMTACGTRTPKATPSTTATTSALPSTRDLIAWRLAECKKRAVADAETKLVEGLNKVDYNAVLGSDPTARETELSKIVWLRAVAQNMGADGVAACLEEVRAGIVQFATEQGWHVSASAAAPLPKVGKKGGGTTNHKPTTAKPRKRSHNGTGTGTQTTVGHNCGSGQIWNGNQCVTSTPVTVTKPVENATCVFEGETVPMWINGQLNPKCA